MHLKRLIVAVVLLPIIYLYIIDFPSRYFFLLLIFLSFIATSEFYSMYRVTGILRYAGLFLGVFILSASYISQDLLLNVVILSIMVMMGIRLYIEVSPNKTVVGAAGSLVGGMVAALLLRATIIPLLTLFYAVLIGIIIGTISIIGDLVESMFKREIGRA